MTSSPVPQPPRPDPPMAPLSKKVIAWVAAGIAAATATLVVVLWWAGTSGLTGDKLVTARFDALRTGLSIGLAGGGLFALYLAWRRQHSTEIGLAQKQQDQADVARAYELQRETFETTRQHQERVAAATERDAEARRITDLYTKAADQLGSDKAPVRLAGLYALERLAQDHVEQRQTIVNVLCAYLRVPYALPGAPRDDTDDTILARYQERIQEREVRMTAQRILTTHLRPAAIPDGSSPSSPRVAQFFTDIDLGLTDTDLLRPLVGFWADIDLDLTGATLIDLNFVGCQARSVTLTRAHITGSTTFTGAKFTGSTTFTGAKFTDGVWFTGAKFTGRNTFTGAKFTDGAILTGVKFTGPAWFYKTEFSGDGAHFYNAEFTSGATFTEAKFTGRTTFTGAKFTDGATFHEATFTGRTSFHKAEFTGDTWFTAVRFAGDVPPEVAQFWSPPVADAGQQEGDETATRQ